MRAKINFVTLSVSGLQDAISFYTRAFGFPISEQTEELCLFALEDDFYLALQDSTGFESQTGRDSHYGGFILSHNAQSVAQAKEIVATALAAGAETVNTLDEEWGYSVTIATPDRHLWEIVHFTNDNA